MFKGTIFDAYPFLLPNVVCTAVVGCGLTVGILFLEETHEDKKQERDRGREIGQWLLSKVWKQQNDVAVGDKDGSVDEITMLLDNDDAMPFTSACSSPTLCSSRSSIADLPVLHLEKGAEPAPATHKAFTKQVCLNIICYGILAL
jgi:hypothetical protein